MKKAILNGVFFAVMAFLAACSSKKAVNDDVAMSGGMGSGSDVAMADLGSSSSGRAR
ncbi:MAG: hypothetical protein KDD51_09710 [Bdellovibrionales bacterium]|nr:hypothetical protein [Bdellovibrionales bacterium]